MTTDLQKLRRFGLAIGLVLFSYSVAGVELQEGAEIRLFGVPFTIERPGLLPAGLMLGSAYALLSFLYYGTMLTESPARKRSPYRRYDPQDPYITTDLGREALAQRIETAFPGVYGSKVTVSITSVPGQVPGRCEVEGIWIPWRVNVAARLEEINYIAPIWINGIALGLAGWRLIAG